MTTNIQSFAGDVQIESGNLSVKSLEVRDGVTKLASNNTAYSNVGVMMTRKDGASNVAFLFSEDGANVVLGYTNDDALEGDQIDILVDEKANLVVYGNVYVTGSVHGDGSTLTGLVTTLQSVTEFGATTNQTLSLTNATTGMNVTSNVVVSGNVTALTFIGDGSQLDGIAATLEEIIINGNTTSNVVEFRNATSLVTTGNVGISNLAPTGDLCIGANVIINDESLDKIDVTGNIACHQLNLGSIEILPAYSLENVTGIGNTTTNVMSFKNTTLAFDTDRMAGIGIIPSAADVGVSGLHVDGHLRLGGAADNTDEENMYIKAAGALGVLANQSDTDNTNTALRLQAGDTNDSNITLYGDLSTTTKQYISMATRNTERLRIDRNGNVGIGTTNPTSNLHVVGNVYATSNLTSGDTVYGKGFVVEGSGQYEPGSIYADANWGMIFRAKTNSPALNDFLWSNSNDFRMMTLSAKTNQSGAKLGIGTDTPTTSLDIHDDDGVIIKIRNDNNIYSNVFIDHGGTLCRQYTSGGVHYSGGIHCTASAVYPANTGGAVTDNSINFGATPYPWNVGYFKRLDVIGVSTNQTSSLQATSVYLGDASIDARWAVGSGGYRLNFFKSNSSGVFEHKSWIEQEGAFTSNAVGINILLYPDGFGAGGFNNEHYFSDNTAKAYLQTDHDHALALAVLNSNTASQTTKHVAIGFFNTDTAGSAKLQGKIAAYPRDANAVSTKICIETKGTNAGYAMQTPTLTCDYNGFVGVGTTSPETKFTVRTTSPESAGHISNYRSDGRYSGLYIVDVGDITPARPADQEYNFLLHGPPPTYYVGGVAHFVNSANRTSDGGSNTYTLRNDIGATRIGSDYYQTYGVNLCGPTLDTYVGSTVYNLSNAVAGHYFYQDIINAPIAPVPTGTYQNRIQIVRQGSLVSISGYVVFQTSVAYNYINLTWAQMGFTSSHNTRVIDNTCNSSQVGSFTLGHDSNYVYLIMNDCQTAPNIVYTNHYWLIDMSEVRAYP